MNRLTGFPTYGPYNVPRERGDEPILFPSEKLLSICSPRARG